MGGYNQHMTRAQLAIIISIGLILAIILGAIGFAAYSYRSPLPQTDGALQVEGARQPITIYRDEWGVPHIYANNIHDLFFAQGYIHAQDRWWQMETRRHIGRGELSIIMGNDPTAQELDRFVRLMGWHIQSEQQWFDADSTTQNSLLAYTRGINSYTRTQNNTDLAVEYTILDLEGRGFDVSGWNPSDSLATGFVMAWQLSPSLDAPYKTERYLRSLPPELQQALDGSTRLLPQLRIDTELITILPPIEANGWVIHGDRTRNALPILAADFIGTASIPSAWYEVGLHCIDITPTCPYDMVGFSYAGLPGIMVGHNADIAWSMTTLDTPTYDLVAIDSDVPTTTRIENILVNDAAPLPFIITDTPYGARITHSADKTPRVLRWGGSQFLSALLALNQANSWEQFQTALDGWQAPVLGFMYADVGGNIAYVERGTVPNGLTWERLTTTIPPQSTSDYLYKSMYDERLVNLLDSIQTHRSETIAGIQSDVYSPFAAQLMPILLTIDTSPALDEDGFPTESMATDYQTWLGEWNLYQQADSPQALFFAILWSEIIARVFDDQSTLSHEALYQTWIFDLLEQPTSIWWDDSTTPLLRETRDDTLRAAFLAAIETTENTFGIHRDRWAWSERHRINFRNMLFQDSNVATITDILNRESSSGGGNSTLNRSTWTTAATTRSDVQTLTTARMIIDLADFGEARSIISTGQSGHPASNHYDDMIPLWRSGAYRNMLWDALTVRQKSESVLRLRP